MGKFLGAQFVTKKISSDKHDLTRSSGGKGRNALVGYWTKDQPMEEGKNFGSATGRGGRWGTAREKAAAKEFGPTRLTWGEKKRKVVRTFYGGEETRVAIKGLRGRNEINNQRKATFKSLGKAIAGGEREKSKKKD